ncbi:sister chromatid cohesion protein Eso1 [Drechmeria coniospora]|uniref:DNA polymerase eta n=1 Tax=Drechmeria coniospora TaxID=98403 RepID=A0A151GRJ8_DRECN|nr:sister chromatid cohesion protein Eso1 [Drechmeria coniospora]KYK59735.1 sister chromatid cohesion protein Eso1 [Drechmeria coniospora]
MMPYSISGRTSPPQSTLGRRSRFTYRQLAQLSSHNTSNPLRVIAHIYLDAFYAQCEMVRLGVPEDRPLAVQQWQGLIAVNYAARKYGIGRHCTVTEAKKLCPDLIAQHVPTWREGDEKWAYRDDAAANIASDKVSLDPYRLQSREILAVIKGALPPDLQRVEKAGIDEVFLDLSAHVHSVLLERFPELSSAQSCGNDPTELLPLPSISALDWQADALVDLDEEEECQDPDWDDVAILVGSEIVRAVRTQVRKKLGYTCSGGIANNKMLSKLGSGFKKPNCQTVIRNRAIHSFLADFKLTKIRNLGGKLGDQVVSTFHTDSVKELLQVPLDQMMAQMMAEDTGLWLYNTIRGIDTSEVNLRTRIKSMLSAKSFRPSINTPDQAFRWLRIFVADIYARLVEEGVLDNKRRPRTVTLHHRAAGQTRSRQGPIPLAKTLDENVLLHLAEDLLRQVISGGRVWPCAHLSLSVGGIEDGIQGNRAIGDFLVKGSAETDVRQATGSGSRPAPCDTMNKKAPVENGGIHRFFGKAAAPLDKAVVAGGPSASTAGGEAALDSPCGSTSKAQFRPLSPSEAHTQDPTSTRGFVCSRCKAEFDDTRSLQSHEDWHMAMDLQDEESGGHSSATSAPTTKFPTSKVAVGTSRRSRSRKLEQGQKKLKFG